MNIPAALPGETLFSRYIRCLSAWEISEYQFLKQVFHRSRTSVHPYLTGGISKISTLTHEDERKIFAEQTLGRLFSYFLPSLEQSISTAMFKGNGNKAIRACQIVSFKQYDALKLSFCPTCAEEDIRNHGVAYWHLVHQVPGVEACPFHKKSLIGQALPGRTHIKKRLLPTSDIKPLACNEESFEFAKYVFNFLNDVTNSSSHFELSPLLNRLNELGYRNKSGRISRINLTHDLFILAQKLNRTSPSLLPSSEADFRYLSYLLSGKVNQHPFKYLLVKFWLSSLDKISTETASTKLLHPSNNSSITENTCKNLLLKGKSLAEISRLTGKSRCYLKALALREKIPIHRIPKVITDVMVKRIIFMAYKGFHRRAIATEFGISTGSVELIISSEKGLVDKRKRYRFESKRRKYKAAILRTTRERPFANKQDIKMTNYNAFHWLYRYEREWLNSALPRATKPIPPMKVDWEARDRALARKVRRLISANYESPSVTQLDLYLGGHGWLTRKKEKLPLTMKVVYQMLNKV